MMREIPLIQRVLASDLVIEGKVVEKNSYWDKSGKYIYTSNKIEVYKVFNGSFSADYIELITEGGTIGLNRIVVEPSLELELNDVGVFTCIPSKIAISYQHQTVFSKYEAYASSQGFIKYHQHDLTATDVFKKYNNINAEIYNVIASTLQKQYSIIKEFNFESSSVAYKTTAVSITGFSPSTITAGTKSTFTITGSGFGTTQGSGTVGFKFADDGGVSYMNPLASQYISWSDGQIVVEVPSKAATGTIRVSQSGSATSVNTLTVTYAQLNVSSGGQAYQTDHINNNGSGGYTWQMFTGFDANAPAKASFMRAFNSWKCGTAINWTVGATTSVDTVQFDGVNIIRFDDGNELPNGVLGRCTSYWFSCGGSTWYVAELDIAFDDGAMWEFGPALATGFEYDFETVALHELGHGHQLGHVNTPGAIMFYALPNATNIRTIDMDDLAGALNVMSRSVVANSCGPGAMTSSGSCVPSADFTGYPTTVCAGGSVTFTDLSTNSPTSWSWTFPGGTPGTSTLQTPAITYTAAGSYSVTLVATNISGSGSKTVGGYITVTASTIPTVVITPAAPTICSGTLTNLSASGATDYLWSPADELSSTTGVTITAGPTVTKTYVVTGASSGCQGTKSITVTVIPLISVTISGTTSICIGKSTNLSASGASDYNWSPSDGLSSTTASVVVASPNTSTVYTVTGTSSLCSGTKNVTLTVNALPTITVTGPSSVCIGNSVSLSASGASTYSWMPEASLNKSTGSSVSASPTVQTVYTVTGANSNGCIGTANKAINTDPCTGIEENVFDNLLIYPNPSSGKFFIDWGNLLLVNYQVEVYDLLGNVLLYERLINSKTEIDLVHSAKGIYFIKITDRHKAAVRKIVVQ